MKIVRVRISGWAIQRGDEWLSVRAGKGWMYSRADLCFFAWADDRASAYVFKRLSYAENWFAANS
jgi:hypothetical protein